jgi:hypothetical protein
MGYKLTRSDWVEIYYAVEFKLTSPAVVKDAAWIRHLKSILAKIGPDGRKAFERHGAHGGCRVSFRQLMEKGRSSKAAGVGAVAALVASARRLAREALVETCQGCPEKNECKGGADET